MMGSEQISTLESCFLLRLVQTKGMLLMEHWGLKGHSTTKKHYNSEIASDADCQRQTVSICVLCDTSQLLRL